MTVTRMCYLSRLRQDAVQTYRDDHANVWPELLATYREAGFRHIHCFLKGCDLVVIGEYDADSYAAKKDWLAAQPVEQDWVRTHARHPGPRVSHPHPHGGLQRRPDHRAGSALTSSRIM